MLKMLQSSSGFFKNIYFYLFIIIYFLKNFIVYFKSHYLHFFIYEFSISEIRNEKDKLINGMNEIESQLAVYDLQPSLTIIGDIDK